MDYPFCITAGTQIGSAHVHAGKNNQDGWAIYQDQQIAIAIVADGCGSAPHSEVGAKLGSKLLCEIIRESATDYSLDWEAISDKFLWQIRVIANNMTADVMQALHDYFLFTVVGCVITPLHSLIFSAGDGYYAINGKLYELQPMQGNRPPYLTLSLIDPRFPTKLSINHELNNAEISSILLATDGFSEIASQEVITDFIDNTKYQKNPDCVRRKLCLLQKEHRLSDDTTLIIIKRATYE